MNITSQDMTFPGADGHMLVGLLARSEGNGSFPAVVVIHEAYGLNENIRDITRRFAGEGYIAFGVDLFAGRNRAVCMARFMGGLVLKSLDNMGIRDLKAALDYLIQQPGVDGARVGAVGYCMGGSFAIAWASADNRLKAIAPYYATNPRPFEAVSRLCPVVGSYPGSDFTAGAGKKLDSKLGELKIEHDIKIYPGAGHSFFNDQKRAYNAEAAQDSWQRTLAFFKQHIGPHPSIPSPTTKGSTEGHSERGSERSEQG
jgi:carboxymethylenebutenolidase